jgi:hypothetical protein
MKYYKPEYFDASKKQKGPPDLTKKDIFGKVVPKGRTGPATDFSPVLPYIASRGVNSC